MVFIMIKLRSAHWFKRDVILNSLFRQIFTSETQHGHELKKNNQPTKQIKHALQSGESLNLISNLASRMEQKFDGMLWHVATI